MKNIYLRFIILFICYTSLNGCFLTGSGYMMANYIRQNTATLADYNDLSLPKKNSKWEQATLTGLKELTGEYEVVTAWGNMVYGIEKVSFHVTDNKVYILTYRNKREIPSYKIEFSRCYSFLDNNGITIKGIGQPNIHCSSRNREHSMVELAKTTTQTTARLQREGFITGLISDIFLKEYVSVTDPYVMKLQIWHDAGSEPILGLRKIK